MKSPPSLISTLAPKTRFQLQSASTGTTLLQPISICDCTWVSQPNCGELLLRQHRLYSGLFADLAQRDSFCRRIAATFSRTRLRSSAAYRAGDSGIGITPDIATGPTNLYFDTGCKSGSAKTDPPATSKTHSHGRTRVSWTKGKHNWKFGAGFSPYQENWTTTTTPMASSISTLARPWRPEMLMRIFCSVFRTLTSRGPLALQHSQQEHLCFRPG